MKIKFRNQLIEFKKAKMNDQSTGGFKGIHFRYGILLLVLCMGSVASHAQVWGETEDRSHHSYSGENGTTIGALAGSYYGYECVFIGADTKQSYAIDKSTFVGTLSSTRGSRNTCVGYYAGGSGFSNSVCLGYYANFSTTDNGRLWITNNPYNVLIYGIFHGAGVGDNGNITSYQKPAVGINTTSPSATLHVRGSFHVDTETSDLFHVDSDESELVFVGSGAYEQFSEVLGNTERAAEYSLWVSQGVVAESLEIVDPEDWSDYVFEDSYQLPNLEDVATEIAQSGHLSGVPSEKEIMENGYSIHDINSRLLAKIEELTLYAIALDKQLKALQEQSVKGDLLAEKINKMEALLTKITDK